MKFLIDTNVILDVLLKREPFYDKGSKVLNCGGYEKDIASESNIEAAVKDLEYFRNELIRLYETKELSDDEILKKIQDEIGLSLEAATAYLEQYGKVHNACLCCHNVVDCKQ